MDAFEVNDDSSSDSGAPQRRESIDMPGVAPVEDVTSALTAELKLDEAPLKKTDYRKVTVDDPQQAGSSLARYYTYRVATDPPVPGVVHVRRRFRDFEWLRDTLAAMYPGIFVPPLPPKQWFGRDLAFARDRGVSLERFMNRIGRIEMFSSTAAFQAFISRHEASLEEARKDIEKDQKKRDIFDALETYLRIFPRATKKELPDDAEEGILRLKTFLENSEEHLTNALKRTESLVEHCVAMHADINAFQGIMQKLSKVESDYAQRPEPPRFDMNEVFTQWSQISKEPAPIFKEQLETTVQYELDDIRAFLEVIKNRDVLANNYKKLKAKGDKWRDPLTTVSAKQLQQKEDDLKGEGDAKNTLEIITKIILSDQIQRVWQEKVAHYKTAMVILAKQLVNYSSALASAWQPTSEVPDEAAASASIVDFSKPRVDISDSAAAASASPSQ